jgi:hypothetical protein
VAAYLLDRIDGRTQEASHMPFQISECMLINMYVDRLNMVKMVKLGYTQTLAMVVEDPDVTVYVNKFDKPYGCVQ